jgi:hypothetical protein
MYRTGRPFERTVETIDDPRARQLLVALADALEEAVAELNRFRRPGNDR